MSNYGLSSLYLTFTFLTVNDIQNNTLTIREQNTARLYIFFPLTSAPMICKTVVVMMNVRLQKIESSMLDGNLMNWNSKAEGQKPSCHG